MRFWPTFLLLLALAGCGQDQAVTSDTRSTASATPTAPVAAAPTSGNVAASPSPSPSPSPSGPPIDFSLTVNPILTNSCGASSCHGVGSNNSVYVGSQANFVRDGALLAARLGSTDSSFMMPMPGFSLADSDKTTLLTYLTQQATNPTPASPAAQTPTPSTAAAPAAPAAPAAASSKLCATVAAADKTTGANMTFAAYTTLVTNNCGGGACHTGNNLPHDFVSSATEAADPLEAAGQIVDLRNGTMPLGKAISDADKASIIGYLCGHLDI